MTLVHNDFQDNSESKLGTFDCGTVIVEGSDFIAEGITFKTQRLRQDCIFIFNLLENEIT
jgi:hypothetical protein